ncbi:MAG: aminotransferase class I/II-fold pyridoxal phosphate-dependent enzyme [Gammaproteobacteria bacterium]|nr:aminotransferase class I/II-fold pyridoxal phosphate-dependent enzyme [Pseudomonadales bacterium]MCP5348123.1 aminotransferase class I/II-fold pyridoxal phosphate-dependent enzyme [Pseudomonadales bacterium]
MNRSQNSRRSFLRNSLFAAGAASVATLQTSPSQVMAQSSEGTPVLAPPMTSEPINIGSNTLSEGPLKAAVEAAARQLPLSGSYGGVAASSFKPTLARQLGVPEDYLYISPGSGPALGWAVQSFVSPTASLVSADLSYEAGWRAALKKGAEVIKVPQNSDWSHDVRGMCAADPKAGVLYICNPNNPTGGITSRADLEYALANKPEGAVLLVDEAYIHFSDNAVSAVDLTMKGDVIVLRTFSKLYGMAGLRLGYAVARPELLEKIKLLAIDDVSSTTYAAGLASITDENLVPQRRAYYGKVRRDTVAWLEAQGYECSVSESNCFIVNVNEDGREFKRKLATYGINIGRTWVGYENWPRLTVGTEAEMAKFREAFTAVMAGKLGPLPMPEPRVAMLDGRFEDAIGAEHGLYELGSRIC